MAKKPPSSNPVRLEKVESIVRIMDKMAGSSSGVSIADIMQEYGICRRTAERMMNVIKSLYPSYEEVPRDDLHKGIFLPTLYRGGPLSFSKSELSALEKAVKLAKRSKMSDVAAEIETVLHRLLAIARPNVRRDAEDASEILVMTQYAGPKVKVDAKTVALIEEAIIKSQKLSFDYTARGTGKKESYTVPPYGILYGSRVYLIAWLDEVNDYRYFAVSGIEKLKLNDGFIRDPGFSLKKYAEQSFGAFQEKPRKIIWKASPKAAVEAANYIFHPTQNMEKQKDGSLIIRFTAGGFKEMCHHLFTWEGEIEIVEPRELKEMMKKIVSRFNNN